MLRVKVVCYEPMPSNNFELDVLTPGVTHFSVRNPETKSMLYATRGPGLQVGVVLMDMKNLTESHLPSIKGGCFQCKDQADVEAKYYDLVARLEATLRGWQSPEAEIRAKVGQGEIVSC